METIVILHGWGGNIESWEPLAEKLRRKKLEVLVPELPGFGQFNIKHPMNTADYSRWLAGFIKKKRLKSYILLGHSFGGQIIINFASNHPKGLQKIILIGAAGIRNKPSLKRLIFTPLAKLGRSWVGDKIKHAFYRFLREVDYYQASPVMKLTLKRILTEDQQSIMPKIAVPTLLIWGTKDLYTPLSDGKKIQQLIPKSKLLVFNDGQHGLHYTHVPQLVEKILWFIG